MDEHDPGNHRAGTDPQYWARCDKGKSNSLTLNFSGNHFTCYRFLMRRHSQISVSSHRTKLVWRVLRKYAADVLWDIRGSRVAENVLVSAARFCLSEVMRIGVETLFPCRFPLKNTP